MMLFAAFWPLWDALPTAYLHWLEVSPGVYKLRQRYDDNSWRDIPTVTSE